MNNHCSRCREPFKPDEKTLDIGLRDGYKICEKCQRQLKIGVGTVEANKPKTKLIKIAIN